MPRPTKCRRVCHFPRIQEFYPQDGEHGEPVILTVDEFETIRLIDQIGLSQEECSKQLGVGRTTVQKIYEVARKKLADTLVFGLPLKIEGGDYRLCNGRDNPCTRQDCYKKQHLILHQEGKGELDYNPDVRCSHHEHEHGAEGHTCGDHGCGHGNCGHH